MDSLESTSVFGELDDSDLALIRSVAEIRSFTTGETIFREGDAGDGIYVVKSGRVRITVVVGQQGEIMEFSKEGAGAIFGEMAIVDHRPRSASAIADQETKAWFIPRDIILSTMERSPRFGSRLMQVVTNRLREFNRQYIQEVLQTERLALVGRFTRSIIHDLKNPLNIIGIATEMATQDDASRDTRKHARERIRKQVDRITSLVNEVMEFTRGSNSTFVLAMVYFDVLIRRVIDEMKSEMNLRAVEIELENDPPHVSVAVNPERFSRVIYNLFVNASDAMQQGGTIRVRFDIQDGEVATTVSDTGPGIPEEVVDSLFVAFVTHGKRDGTGLGLSICQRIIEDHRGKITACNLPEGGAAFTFTLPIKKGEASGTVNSIEQAVVT